MIDPCVCPPKGKIEDVWPADAGLGRGGQGSLCPETAPRGLARHAVGAPHLEWPLGLSPPCALTDHRRWDHRRWPALGTGAGRSRPRSPRLFPASAALEAEAPAIFAEVSSDVWRWEWVSFCKHYGHGNDAVLTYLSRYVFRTAISNARILDMDQTHVTFRWKDRGASAWRTERLPGVEFTPSASFSTSCREGFTRSDTTGSGTRRSETSPTVPGYFSSPSDAGTTPPGR